MTAVRYRPPLRDIGFALENAANLPDLLKLDAYSHADRQTVEMILGECGRFAAEVLAPLDRAGDRAGCAFDSLTGDVRMPEGWRRAYRSLVHGGWGTAHLSPEYGGGGFPFLVGAAIQ